MHLSFVDEALMPIDEEPVKSFVERVRPDPLIVNTSVVAFATPPVHSGTPTTPVAVIATDIRTSLSDVSGGLTIILRVWPGAALSFLSKPI
jgi:hypothetical protein